MPCNKGCARQRISHNQDNAPHSPTSTQAHIGTHGPYALFLTVWADRHAARLVPKDPLEAQAEAIDLIVPLFPDLVTMVQLERFDLP